MKIDWESSESYVLLNPRLDLIQRAFLEKMLPRNDRFAGHVWLMTSGSTALAGHHKCVALSKKALLASARAVNSRLLSTKLDFWLNPLPLFHVGGLGIEARAFLSNSPVVNFSGKWDCHHFYQALVKNKASLTALVPTQLHDLVHNHYLSPQFLRGVIIGGGRLEESLYQKACELKWPIMPSYGLSEASSQVATALVGTADLQVLDHIQVKVDASGRLCLKGESLLTAYAYIKDDSLSIRDPKVEEWFQTEDLGYVSKGIVKVIGRGVDFVKIGGESVNLSELEKKMEHLKDLKKSTQTIVLAAVVDFRLGHVIHAFVEGETSEETKNALEAFQAFVMPFARIRKIHEVAILPRTDLGKIQKQFLLQSLSLEREDF